jgi:hypothetical protein
LSYLFLFHQNSQYLIEAQIIWLLKQVCLLNDKIKSWIKKNYIQLYDCDSIDPVQNSFELLLIIHEKNNYDNLFINTAKSAKCTGNWG